MGNIKFDTGLNIFYGVWFTNKVCRISECHKILGFKNQEIFDLTLSSNLYLF